MQDAVHRSGFVSNTSGWLNPHTYPMAVCSGEKVVDDAQCSKPCAGNANEICGGAAVYSVYEHLARGE